MKRAFLSLAVVALALGAMAPTAQAEFGLSEFKVAFTDKDGSAVTQAGSHPYAMKTSLAFSSTPIGSIGEVSVDGAVKDILLTQAQGFVGNPTAVPRCATSDFLTEVILPGSSLPVPDCPDASAVGTTSVLVSAVGGSPQSLYGAVYDLEPPPGVAAKLGFFISGIPVTVEVGVNESPPYNIVAGPTNISQVLEVVGATFTLWGNPADKSHDPLRGHCLSPGTGVSFGKCPANISTVPFLTMPRSCDGPLTTDYAVDSWQNPGLFVKGLTESAQMAGCGQLGFGPEIDVQPTTTSAGSASGLELNIDVKDEGIANPDGRAQADIAATEFAFAPGITVNPSAAEGLGVCTPDQFQAASLTVRGCPEASKLGTLDVDTPILENHTLHGSFYLAQQDDPSTSKPRAENPFDSLLAAYLVIRDPELGVFVKLPAKIETDETTGQIHATVKDMPAFPLEAVAVHLRSGPRAPLITPSTCGSHTSTATLYPSSGAKPIETDSTFQIISGPNGGPCPAGGTPPFDPGFEAGSENGAAGRYSPFSMRLIRSDGQQDLTRFSATLPPGVLGKLAGVGKCPDAAIATAKTKTGRQEQAFPSCPASSLVGKAFAGVGVGSALTYVPGSLYMAGPYRGAPLSIAAIVPAVAGPFDVGTVVTRVALKVNPTTAQVEVDGAASDPIPHILKGIPVAVRDIRVFTDRPNFTLNPTSCDPLQTTAQIFGSGANPFNTADDSPLPRSARYQAASCASLGFGPKLDFKLKGGTGRGGHPALTATYTPRKDDANLSGLVVRLPHSAFLDQAHIRTICTRVQFAAKACPPGAQYGSIEAFTPLLEEPLRGPVYLRSSSHDLPDLVFDLHGLIDVEVVARIDSKNGGIRATIEGAPDAPIAKVILRMQGARKGLIVNSRDLCGSVAKANVEYSGQNGKQLAARPVLRADCGGKREHERQGRSS